MVGHRLSASLRARLPRTSTAGTRSSASPTTTGAKKTMSAQSKCTCRSSVPSRSVCSPPMRAARRVQPRRLLRYAQHHPNEHFHTLLGDCYRLAKDPTQAVANYKIALRYAAGSRGDWMKARSWCGAGVGIWGGGRQDESTFGQGVARHGAGGLGANPGGRGRRQSGTKLEPKSERACCLYMKKCAGFF